MEGSLVASGRVIQRKTIGESETIKKDYEVNDLLYTWSIVG